jgi:hypothetical protein
MPKNKISYISDEAERKADVISIDTAINAAVEGFLKGEPIDDLLSLINSDEDKFTTWVYDTEIFLDDEYVWIFSEEAIFVTDDNILDYYELEELDITTDEDILKFIYNSIESKCEDTDAWHYKYYKGVYISATCQSWGQGGLHFMDFCIHKTKDGFLKECEGYILYLDKCLSHKDAELISMFKKHITDKYFKG